MPDPVLGHNALRVTDFGESLATLSEFMITVMQTQGGVGLAANQIGIAQDLFVYDPGDGRGPWAVANGRVTSMSGEKFAEEGCLSMHGWRFEIPRAIDIEWTGQDIKGNPCGGSASGLAARIIQHETDHLRGRSLLNYVSKHDKLLVLGLVVPPSV